MVTMQVLPNREDWLKHRTKIGGSDASAILGKNPYKTNVELWKDKAFHLMPEDISDKPYVKYGIQAEPHLRALFSLDFPEKKVFYEENNMWTNDKYPFAHASLDGWFEDPDGKKGILEIKTTNILNSSQRRNWKDHYIPENYYVQVLHYLMVTEFDYVVIAAQLKSVFDGYVTKQTIYETVYRNEKEEEIAYLADEERKFWTCVENMKAPPLKLPDL